MVEKGEEEWQGVNAVVDVIVDDVEILRPSFGRRSGWQRYQHDAMSSLSRRPPSAA